MIIYSTHVCKSDGNHVESRLNQFAQACIYLRVDFLIFICSFMYVVQDWKTHEKDNYRRMELIEWHTWQMNLAASCRCSFAELERSLDFVVPPFSG